MAESVCKVLHKFLSKLSEFEDLRSTYVANSVFNGFLCYTTIALNIVTIHAIRKTSSLPKPLKTLLLSLAVSDVGVGLLAQPLFISLMIRWSQRNIPDCISYKAFTIVIILFLLASFCGVVAISVDRFLAIHLHLRYQELVTHKRVVAVVISIWMFSTFLSLSLFWLPWDIIWIILSVFGMTCLLLTAIVYWRIFLVLRRHKNQFQVQALQMHELQQAIQNGDIDRFVNLRKSSVCVLYMYLLFVVCYLPLFIAFPVHAMQGPNLVTSKILLYAETLMFLNSSLNPLIYCWKMRHIRHAIVDMLRNIKRQ